jgi:antitoxin (DNA-binding transcriptional repressor) of toxin-antitoxin stability system
MTVTIPNAKLDLDTLIKRASLGEDVVITDQDIPVARLISVQPNDVKPAFKPLPFGYAKSQLRYMADDFDAPLDDFKEYMI